ncbi:ABC transporter ATP-binding protein [Ideonella sp. DXS29W]|uniref:ABC transporter ATP-binding protein n=1 Tax=Ideonella lacteola TaxID=2984193 RepID=A0ABU9BRK2_9BURK
MNAAHAVKPERELAWLDVEAVSVRFGGVRAVTDVSFGVHRGEVLSIIGPNGAGKSSLLNVISGVYRAQQGRLHFEGQLLPQASPRDAAQRGIGRTFQNLALFRGMSVLENVLTGRVLLMRSSMLAHAAAWPRAQREERAHREAAHRVIDFLGLQRVRDMPVHQLPYGLQKRVELARALAAEPRLLLLDEPMAGMNSHDKHEMSRVIVEANRKLGITIVLIEHDMGVVMDVSDRVVVLDYGKKIADGRPGAVRDDPAVVAAYLGLAQAA